MNDVVAISEAASACSSSAEFRDVAFSHLRKIFDADLLSFFRWDSSGGIAARLAEDDLFVDRWDQDMRRTYHRSILRSDPVNQLLQNRAYRENAGGFRLSSYTKGRDYGKFYDFLEGLGARHLLTIAITSGGSLLANISVGRSRRDFTDAEVRLAQWLSAALGAAYVSSVSRCKLSAYSLAIDEMRQRSGANVLAVVADDRLMYWDHELASSRGLGPEQAFALLTRPEGMDGKISQPLVNTSIRAANMIHHISVQSHWVHMQWMRVIRLEASWDLAERHQQQGCDLTARERQVGHLAAVGLTAHQVADQLNISHWTVKNHLKKIYFKTGAKNRVDLLHKIGRRGASA